MLFILYVHDKCHVSTISKVLEYFGFGLGFFLGAFYTGLKLLIFKIVLQKVLILSISFHLVRNFYVVSLTSDESDHIRPLAPPDFHIISPD